MKNKTMLILLAGIIATVLAGVFLYNRAPKTEAPAATQTATQTAATDTASAASDGRYTNPNYAFSFMPPPGFTVTSFDDPDGEGDQTMTVLVQNTNTNNKDKENSGVQIVISSWDEPEEAFTEARIRKDIPDMKLVNVLERTIEGVGNVITFESNNSAFGGKSYEAWFIAHGDLYQASTYASSSSLLDGIISSWHFDE